MKYKNLIFDLDDTILICSEYYHKCRDTFAAEATARTGISPEVVDKMLTGIDVACMGLDNGFGKERFPRSFAACSIALDIICDKTPDIEAAQRAFVIGDSVFWEDYPIINGAAEILQTYKDAGYNLFLYTKGDYAVQQRKIDINKLNRFFDADKVYIVGKKGGFQIDRIVADHNLIKDETVMIGDSIRDDIRSANEAGIDCVYVWADGRRQWDKESINKFKPNCIITSIKVLPLIFDDPIYMGYTYVGADDSTGDC